MGGRHHSFWRNKFYHGMVNAYFCGIQCLIRNFFKGERAKRKKINKIMKTIFHFHLIVISSVLLSVDSCHKNQSSNTAASSAGGTPQQSSTTTSNAPATTTSTQITPQPINTTASPKEEEATVRFIVSFYSIGEGVDEDLNKEFVKFLDSFPKKIEYEKKNWGRGGEFDYCLALKDFSDAEKDEFARKAKKK